MENRAEKMLSYFMSKEFSKLSVEEKKNKIRKFAEYIKDGSDAKMFVMDQSGSTIKRFSEFINEVGVDKFTDLFYDATILHDNGGLGLLQNITKEDIENAIAAVAKGNATERDNLIVNMLRGLAETRFGSNMVSDMASMFKMLTSMMLDFCYTAKGENIKIVPSAFIFSLYMILVENSVINNGYFKRFGDDSHTMILTLSFTKSIGDQIYDAYKKMNSGKQIDDEAVAIAMLFKAYTILSQNRSMDKFSDYTKLYERLHLEQPKKDAESEKNGSNTHVPPSFDSAMFDDDDDIDDEPEEKKFSKSIDDFINKEKVRDFSKEQGQDFLRD